MFTMYTHIDALLWLQMISLQIWNVAEMCHMYMMKWKGMKTPAAHRFKGKLTTMMSRWKTDPRRVALKWKGLTHLPVTLRGLYLLYWMGKNSDHAIGTIMFQIYLNLNCYVKITFFLLIRPNLPENKGREKKRYPMKMVCNFYNCGKAFFQVTV